MKLISIFILIVFYSTDGSCFLNRPKRNSTPYYPPSDIDYMHLHYPEVDKLFPYICNPGNNLPLYRRRHHKVIATNEQYSIPSPQPYMYPFQTGLNQGNTGSTFPDNQPQNPTGIDSTPQGPPFNNPPLDNTIPPNNNNPYNYPYNNNQYPYNSNQYPYNSNQYPYNNNQYPYNNNQYPYNNNQYPPIQNQIPRPPTSNQYNSPNYPPNTFDPYPQHQNHRPPNTKNPYEPQGNWPPSSRPFINTQVNQYPGGQTLPQFNDMFNINQLGNNRFVPQYTRSISYQETPHFPSLPYSHPSYKNGISSYPTNSQHSLKYDSNYANNQDDINQNTNVPPVNEDKQSNNNGTSATDSKNENKN